MKLGMSCYCLDPAMASGQMSVDDVVDYAVAHGCEHIEFVPFRLAFVTPERTLDWELIDHVREKCKSAGIEISTYSVNADLLKTDPEEEEREIERVKRHIDAAQGLGLSRMRFDVASFRRPFSTNTIYQPGIPPDGEERHDPLRLCRRKGHHHRHGEPRLLHQRFRAYPAAD